MREPNTAGTRFASISIGAPPERLAPSPGSLPSPGVMETIKPNERRPNRSLTKCVQRKDAVSGMREP
jgi:hypothetical protein